MEFLLRRQGHHVAFIFRVGRGEHGRRPLAQPRDLAHRSRSLSGDHGVHEEAGVSDAQSLIRHLVNGAGYFVFFQVFAGC